MEFHVSQNGWESRIEYQKALLVRSSLLGANPHNAGLENTYNPPLLSVQRMLLAQSTPSYNSHSTVKPGYAHSTYTMEEEYRLMTDEERGDIDLEIDRIRTRELGYILRDIPLNASHAERITRLQQTGLLDRFTRFRPQPQARASSSNANSSFSQPAESASTYQEPSANSVALTLVIQFGHRTEPQN